MSRLPREVGDASSLETFKVQLDVALSNLVMEGVPAHLQGCWMRSPLKVPSNPNHS